MRFDSENPVNKLCAKGILLEGEGKATEAAAIFEQAWKQSTTDLEKLTAAHYMARHQNTIYDKLKWDETALQFALNITGDEIKATYPSLYLNIGKCYEDLKDYDNASASYQKGLSYINFLPNDGYGNMIRSGIDHGIQRVSDQH